MDAGGDPASHVNNAADAAHTDRVSLCSVRRQQHDHCGTRPGHENVRTWLTTITTPHTTRGRVRNTCRCRPQTDLRATGSCRSCHGHVLFGSDAADTCTPIKVHRHINTLSTRPPGPPHPLSHCLGQCLCQPVPTPSPSGAAPKWRKLERERDIGVAFV